MEIIRSGEQVVIAHLDIFSCEMLRLIPFAADPAGNSEVEERLFSKPEALEGEFTKDWRSYVEPGLRHLFVSAVETVAADLKNLEETVMEDGTPLRRIRIPAAHLDAWVNAINQARLVIATRYHFTERDLDGSLPEEITTDRDVSLVQIHVYDFLLLSLLHELE